MIVSQKMYVCTGCVGGEWGNRMEWFKRFSHLECLCYIVCACVYMCPDLNICVESSMPTASETSILWEVWGRRIWPQGGDRAPGSFVLCSWFSHYSPAGSQRSVKGDTTPGSADEAWSLDRAANKRGKMFNTTNLAFSCLPLYVFFSLTPLVQYNYALCLYSFRCLIIHIFWLTNIINLFNTKIYPCVN